MLTALLTCWTRAPLEIAEKAFYADQKFPKELRHNYGSIRGAFFGMARRNPWLLFKNSYPTVVGTFFETFVAFWSYDHIRDNSRFFVNELEFSSWPFMICNALASATFGLFFYNTYGYYMRNLVEFPQSVATKELFQGNYRKAHGYLQVKDDLISSMSGTKKTFRNNFLGLTLTLLFAEKLGLFKKWQSPYDRHPYSSSEKSFYLIE